VPDLQPQALVEAKLERFDERMQAVVVVDSCKKF
jgi:hypothetical protein